MKLNVLASLAVALCCVGCSAPTLTGPAEPIFYSTVEPASPYNPCAWVGNIHNGALEYIATRVPAPYSKADMADESYAFLDDSLTLSGATMLEAYDSVEAWLAAKTWVQWNLHAYQTGKITATQHGILDELAILNDSVGIYDSASYVNRIAEVDQEIAATISVDTQRVALWNVSAIMRSSFYYWTYQVNNPLTSVWPSTMISGTKEKGKGNRILISERTKNIIKADGAGAGVSLASDIGQALVVMATGVGTIPTTVVVTGKAILSGLAASAFEAFWN